MDTNELNVYSKIINMNFLVEAYILSCTIHFWHKPSPVNLLSV